MTSYRVGEVARLSGVSPRTIDFYTSYGLLEPASRSPGGHRLYGDDAPHRVQAIRALRARGLSLDAARRHLASGSESELLARAEQFRGELGRMQRELGELRERLRGQPVDSEPRLAAERALQAALVGALGLAHELARLVSSG
jgi:MerR family copper efflux transcriptional regulator